MSLKSALAYKATLPARSRRNSEVMRWHTALDNYSPTRDYANGHSVSFIRPDTGETGYVLFGIDKLTIPSESIYVIDNGETVTAMYPAAWHGIGDEFGPRVVLHPISSDTGVLTFGPKRAYHIRFSAI